jgi:hypothetical protein
MVALELRGRITEAGTLDVQLPAGLPAGEVTVRIEMQPWTKEELRTLIQPKRTTMKEMIDWVLSNPPGAAWGDLKDDEDVGEHIHQLRRQSSIDLDVERVNE